MYVIFTRNFKKVQITWSPSWTQTLWPSTLLILRLNTNNQQRPVTQSWGQSIQTALLTSTAAAWGCQQLVSKARSEINSLFTQYIVLNHYQVLLISRHSSSKVQHTQWVIVAERKKSWQGWQKLTRKKHAKRKHCNSHICVQADKRGVSFLHCTAPLFLWTSTQRGGEEECYIIITKCTKRHCRSWSWAGSKQRSLQLSQRFQHKVLCNKCCLDFHKTQD